MAEDVDEAELIRGAILAQMREFRSSLPGRVVSYDAAKQRASVRLQLSFYMMTTDDQRVPIDHPVLSNVPVAFPGGGGAGMWFGLAKDDPVVVMFCDVPIGAWLARGTPCEPGVDDLHSIGGAVALALAPRPTGQAAQSADGSLTRIGIDSDTAAQIEFAAGQVRLGQGATEALAIASKVHADMVALKTAFAAWTPVLQDGGTALKTLLTTLIGTPWPAASYDSSNAKAKP